MSLSLYSLNAKPLKQTGKIFRQQTRSLNLGLQNAKILTVSFKKQKQSNNNVKTNKQHVTPVLITNLQLLKTKPLHPNTHHLPSILKHHNHLLPDTPLILSILKACGGLHFLKPGQQLHALSILNGWSLHPFIASGLVLFYIKCGEIAIARKVFDEMREKDLVAGSALVSGYARKGCVKEAREVFGGIGGVNVVTWNGMVAGFYQSGRCLEAVEVFKEMCEQGFKADGTAVLNVLSAVRELGNFGDLGVLNDAW
ncbi:pentatricopeptide repeat-containing protein, partial [Tanacetum coccineum]